MRELLAILIVLGVFMAGAIAHESDIYDQCVKTGTSGNSMWTATIKCEPIGEGK